MSTHKALRAAGALVTALSLCTLPALADNGVAPTPECGGDKGDKEVKKPKGDEDKKPTNPAALCGGDKGDKEVKKPKGDEDKKPTNPA
jgi:hypothetical protein